MLVSETRALPLGDTPIALNKLLNDFLNWLGYEDSNLGMPESESGALPLGDTPTGCTYKVSVLNKLAGVRGFEPRNAGIRIRCLTAWRYPNKLVFEFAERIRHIQNLVATTGFEPVTPSL